MYAYTPSMCVYVDIVFELQIFFDFLTKKMDSLKSSVGY